MCIRDRPLGVTFYSTSKGAFKKECDLYMKRHRLVRITPYDLAGIFNQAYSRVATIAVAVSGFKGTGIYPLNPNVFTDDDFCAADVFVDRQNVSIPVIENDDAGVEPSGRPTPCTTSNEEPNQKAGGSKEPQDPNKSVTFEDLIPLPVSYTHLDVYKRQI